MKRDTEDRDLHELAASLPRPSDGDDAGSIAVDRKRFARFQRRVLFGLPVRRVVGPRASVLVASLLGMAALATSVARADTSTMGIVELALGDASLGGHSCVRTVDGQVLCWGPNNRGNLGFPPDESKCRGIGGSPCSRHPHRVPGLTGATQLALGDGFTCALVGGHDGGATAVVAGAPAPRPSCPAAAPGRRRRRRSV